MKLRNRVFSRYKVAFLCTLVALILLMPTLGCWGGTSALVIYQRSGGFVGLRDQLTIYPDGRCELQRKGSEWEFTLKPNELAHLKDLMDEADFISLNHEYLPMNDGADLIEYTVSYQVEGDKMHTVRTVDGAVPDPLQPVLKQLNQFISNQSSSHTEMGKEQ